MTLTTVHKMLLFFALMSALMIFVGYKIASDTEPTPCSPNGNPARCYHVAEHACEVVWEKAETSCKQFIDGQGFPPGRLIGPVLFKCRLSIFDQAFAASRRSTPECNEMFADLTEWKQRNSFKSP